MHETTHPRVLVDGSTVNIIVQDLTEESRLSEIWMNLHYVGNECKVPTVFLLNKSDLVTTRNILIEDLDVDLIASEYPGLLVLPFCAHSSKDIALLRTWLVSILDIL